VYYRARVRISRGRPNETSRIQPQTCAFQVNNRDGRFSPRNPNGAYYGLIGRNTQVRVSRLQNGVRRYRFHGEVVSWPTTWEISGSDVWVDVTAAGMLRRLQQGTPPVVSAMTRGYTTLTGALAPVAYWPCEDGTAATSLASALSAAPPMSVSGTPTLASNTRFPSSQPLPLVSLSTWSGLVPPYAGGTDNVLRFLLAVPLTGMPANAIVATMYTTGTVARLDMSVTGGGSPVVTGYDNTGLQVFTGTVAGVLVNDGTVFRCSIALRSQPPNVEWECQILRVGQNFAVAVSGTQATATLGNATRVVINAGGVINDTAVGHVSVQSVWDTLLDLAQPDNAWIAELPPSRMTRLCAEQGISGALVAPGELGTDGVTMGYQLPDTFPNLLQQVPDTDLGFIYEARDQLGLAYRTRLSLYSQGTAYNPQRGLTLDTAQHQLSGPLNPLDDDANVRNDVTVGRIGGSSARKLLATGVLSVAPPPGGAGPYDTAPSISLGVDALLPDAASWRLHLGTVDEPRYSQIMLNLRHPQFTTNTDLLNQALVMDIGDLVAVNNPPAWMPPDQIRQILQGYSETLGVFEHDMVLNCSPEAPYRVGVLEDKVLSRADTDGSALAAPLGPALNANPFFTGGSLNEWSAFAGSIAAVGTSGSPNPLPAGGPSGYGALLTPDGSLSNCALSGGSTPGFYIPVAPGGTYQVSALVYSPGGYGNVELGFDFYDASQAYITTSSVLSAVTAATWTALSTSQTAGGTAAFMRPRVGEKSSPTAANTLYIAAVVAWQGAASVASANTLLPLWTTSAGAFPFDVAVSPLGSGGERMTVTGITGGASPQAFTVARGVNGACTPWPAGSDVRLWQPCTVSL
jgi:hypothetical protein